MYRYFIFFNFFMKDGRIGVANMETSIDKEITCFDDIKEIEKSILDKNKNYEKVIINNYISFPSFIIY